MSNTRNGMDASTLAGVTWIKSHHQRPYRG